MNMNIIEKALEEKYGDYLVGLDVYETATSLILSRIVLNKESRNAGIGTQIMTDLINYADKNKQIIALTPSSDFGGNKNKLIQFYKKFGFKKNAGQYKHYEFKDDMIRYPRGLNESKLLIKTLLREALDKTIKCNECGWTWKESESSKKDLYNCHKCGHDNTPKKSLNESLLTKKESDLKKIADFVNFAKEYLEIDDDVKIELAFEKTPDIRTTAYYNNGDKRMRIYVKNRAVIDICRSIAHELVHHKQNIDGKFEDAKDPGADGSEFENEANAVSGVIIRKWGRLNPEIYD